VNDCREAPVQYNNKQTDNEEIIVKKEHDVGNVLETKGMKQRCTKKKRMNCLFGSSKIYVGRMAVPYPRRLVAGFPPWRPGFEPKSSLVGFVVDKVALGQVFSEYFCFRNQFSFDRLLHIHHHLSSEAGTVGQLMACVPSGLSLIPPQETKKKN
jgi:hypothetical protein